MEGDDDSDSALGLDATSSTDSLTSSILRYRTLNGRTYHSERGNAQYWYHKPGPSSGNSSDA